MRALGLAMICWPFLAGVYARAVWPDGLPFSGLACHLILFACCVSISYGIRMFDQTIQKP